ncbi:DNA-binding response regulator [Halobacillus halophilus]|uniref:Two-component response regulator n=1 Tax=Halobacillus halophilus (strain ATCC 35676 / DSM 2266 / JCM 20832 / KCTC 3685 / LMG 17431 / NBRC 102448 / NCIMB 2269) TaxID=866895 RepID=I0JTL9_HALH3|nr:response regulator transcription factor [Halobacillus halophilus]ASF41400.1 DNA-binding response regulator [Halobacillus halophilus]CCG47492.1 two-component response regulator [Halobacillus halophilus DSM 2266]
MIRVMIAEDQTMLRGALCTILDMEDDFEVTGAASHGEEALQMIQDHEPDIALLDIEMPLLTGIEVLKEIRRLQLPTKVIILTTFSKRIYIKEAWEHQVDGYLLKDTPSEELARNVRQVYKGQQVVSPSLVSQTVLNDENELTGREIEVLLRVEKGYSTKQISEAMHLTNGTIRNYLSEIMNKLDAQNRTEAAFIARQKGWLD